MSHATASTGAASAPPRQDPVPWLRTGIVVVVVVGLAAGLLRPFVPDLGAIPPPTRWFDERYLALAESFRTPRYAVALAILGIRLVVPLAVALTPAGRRAARAVCERVGRRRPARAAAAVVLLVVVATDVLVLPLEFWLGYVHDGAYGLRTQGPAGWWRDWILGTAPPWFLVAGLTVGGWWLARRLPRTWPHVGGLLAAGLVVVVVALAPVVLEPLQLRTTPLEAGPLRADIEQLAARAGRGDLEVVVADASRRTTRQNAYVSGIGATQQIVLYDTLVAEQPNAVVLSVLAHELAHDRNGDLWRGAAMGAAAVALAGPGLGMLLRWRVRTGRQHAVADPRAAPAVLVAVVLALLVVAPAERAISREVEAAADLGGLALSGDPDTYVEQRLAVTRANLGHPDPPSWVRFLWSSHPSSVERLALAERWPVEPVRPLGR